MTSQKISGCNQILLTKTIFLYLKQKKIYKALKMLFNLFYKTKYIWFYLSMDLWNNQSIYQSIYGPMDLYIHLSIYTSINLLVHPSIH